MLFSLLGESRESFTGGEGDSIILWQGTPKEALLTENFGEASKLDVTFMLPNEFLKNLRPGKQAILRTYPQRRAFWVSFRDNFNHIRHFAIESITEGYSNGTTTEVDIIARDARSFLENTFGLRSGGTGYISGTITSILEQLTQRVSNTDKETTTGKNDKFRKPIISFDANWTPSTAEQELGFVQWSSVESGAQFSFEDCGPLPIASLLGEVLDSLEASYNDRYELWPLQIDDPYGSNNPYFRWVLRKRIQTNTVISSYSGSFALDSVVSDLTAGDVLTYRDDNKRFVFSNGADDISSNWRGAWARGTTKKYSPSEGISSDFVKAASSPTRLEITGKGNIPYELQPGSYAYFRNEDTVFPITLDSVYQYFGSSNWNLGAVSAKLKALDSRLHGEPAANSIVFTVSGSTTYTLPFNQAPVPSGGVTVTVYDTTSGYIEVGQATFTENPSSAAFNNEIQISLGDLNEHEITISVDGNSAFGRHTFGAVNCYDGVTLHSASDSVFKYIKILKEWPLFGYLRSTTRDGLTGYAFYGARAFKGATTLTTVPSQEDWGGWNTSSLMKNLFGFIPLTGGSLGVFEETFYGCTALTSTVKEVDFPTLEKTDLGYRRQQYYGCTNSSLGTYKYFAKFDSLEEFLAPIGGSLGVRYNQFYNARLTGNIYAQAYMPSLKYVPDNFFRGILYNAININSASYEFTFGTYKIEGNYFLAFSNYKDTLPSNGNLAALSYTFASTVDEWSGTYGLYQAKYNHRQSVTSSFQGFDSIKKIGSVFFMQFSNSSDGNGKTTHTAGFPSMEALEEAGDDCFYKVFGSLLPTSSVFPDFPSLKKVGRNFFREFYYSATGNPTCTLPSLSSLVEVGDYFYRSFYGYAAFTTPPTISMASFAPNLQKVGNYFFSDNSSQNSLVLPAWNNLTEIGDYFLYRISGATLVLPTLNSCRTVGSYFESEMSTSASVATFEFPAYSTIVSAGSYLFSYNGGIKASIRIVPSMLGLTKFADNAFLYFASTTTSNRNSSLTKIVFPSFSHISSIGKYFCGDVAVVCPNLTEVVFEDTLLPNITSIGDYFFHYAFSSDKSLQNISFPSTGGALSTIGSYFMSYAFYGATSLTSVELPELNSTALRTIGSYFMQGTFSQAYSLTSVELPELNSTTLRTIGSYFMQGTFSYATSLTSVELPELNSTALSWVGDYFLSETFKSATSLVNPVEEYEFSATTSIGWYFMYATYKNATSLTSMADQKLTGLSVDPGGYRYEMYLGCTAITTTQAVWDKPSFTYSPYSATSERCRRKSAGGLSTSICYWRDGSGAITPPSDGTDTLGIPSDFFTA